MLALAYANSHKLNRSECFNEMWKTGTAKWTENLCSDNSCLNGVEGAFDINVFAVWITRIYNLFRSWNDSNDLFVGFVLARLWNVQTWASSDVLIQKSYRQDLQRYGIVFDQNEDALGIKKEKLREFRNIRNRKNVLICFIFINLSLFLFVLKLF